MENNSPSSNEPEDIFADVDQVPYSPDNNHPQTNPTVSILAPQKSKKGKYIFIFLLLILIVGAYFYYPQINIFFGSAKNKVANLISNFSFSDLTAPFRKTQVTPLKSSSQDTVQPEPAGQSSTNPIETIKNSPVSDQDSDGLSDTEEAQYGTNSQIADSDQDGLTDREEIKIYHTNPMNPDTDKDGVTDGDEIKIFLDPNNPTLGAKLIDLETAILELNQQ